MAPNFKVHAAEPPRDDVLTSKIGAVLLGPPGSGKGTVVNTIGLIALFIHSYDSVFTNFSIYIFILNIKEKKIIKSVL